MIQSASPPCTQLSKTEERTSMAFRFISSSAIATALRALFFVITGKLGLTTTKLLISIYSSDLLIFLFLLSISAFHSFPTSDKAFIALENRSTGISSHLGSIKETCPSLSILYRIKRHFRSSFLYMALFIKMFNQFVYGSLVNGIRININIIVNPIGRELDCRTQNPFIPIRKPLILVCIIPQRSDS